MTVRQTWKLVELAKFRFNHARGTDKEATKAAVYNRVKSFYLNKYITRVKIDTRNGFVRP
jgi:hypothetical protein